MTDQEFEEFKDIELHFTQAYKIRLTYESEDKTISARCDLTDSANYRMNFTPIMRVNKFMLEELTRE